MRILALSDNHGLLPDLDVSDADCVMIAGDICPPWLQSPLEQRPWLENEFGPWAKSLNRPVYDNPSSWSLPLDREPVLIEI